ncbi:hypothetical protein ACFL04_04465 [Patescibacteria group bacterium]
MYITLHKDWNFYDSSAGENVIFVVPEGRYPIDRRPHPFGKPGNWLFLENTPIGLPEKYLRQYTTHEGKLKVEIEE